MIDLDEAKLLAKSDPLNVSIGIQKEHNLHKVIKYMIDPTGIYHEVKINGKIVDVYLNDEIYEIQTKAFNNLRAKLSSFLKDYKVTICYPLVCSKIINRINDEGEIISIRKSPKKGKLVETLVELYKIKNHLKNENLQIMILEIDIEEYQQVVEKSYKNHHGRLRINQVPIKLHKVTYLKDSRDYKMLLPLLPDEFNASDLAKNLNISKHSVGYIIQVLKYVDVVEVIKKDGKKHIYHLK